MQLKRQSQEWLEYVTRTGEWYHPPYWQEDSYLAMSPWTSEELEFAFEAAKKVYPAEIVFRIFAERQPHLFHLLLDPWWPERSSLLSLGFDAIIAQPWQRKDLLRRLRQPSEYEGARFELEIFAAFQRAGIPCTHEPFQNAGGVNPDFLINIGQKLVVDVKHVRMSERIEEELKWFNCIVGIFDHTVPFVPANIELTDKLSEMRRTEEGRRWIRQNYQRLAALVRETRQKLSLSNSFPVTGDVEGLVHLEILGPGGQGGGGHYSGLPLDLFLEAQRIVRGCLTDGAGQIPVSHSGLVVIDIGMHTTLLDVQSEAKRWFVEEGNSYTNLMGVALINFGYYEHQAFRAFLPIWRSDTPESLSGSDVWGQFSIALNWRSLRIVEWMDKRESRNEEDKKGGKN